jgi:hypothetical protein
MPHRYVVKVDAQGPHPRPQVVQAPPRCLVPRNELRGKKGIGRRLSVDNNQPTNNGLAHWVRPHVPPYLVMGGGALEARGRPVPPLRRAGARTLVNADKCGTACCSGKHARIG